MMSQQRLICKPSGKRSASCNHTSCHLCSLNMSVSILISPLVRKVCSGSTRDLTIKNCNVLHMWFQTAVCEGAGVCACAVRRLLSCCAVRLGNTKHFMDEMHIGSSCFSPAVRTLPLLGVEDQEVQSQQSKRCYFPSSWKIYCVLTVCRLESVLLGWLQCHVTSSHRVCLRDSRRGM